MKMCDDQKMWRWKDVKIKGEEMKKECEDEKN